MKRSELPIRLGRSLGERLRAFGRAELRHARWLASRAIETGREDGLVAIVRGIPSALGSLARSAKANGRAVFFGSAEARRTWEDKDGWYSPAYYAMVGPNETSEQLRATLDQRVDEDAKILEIGCSSGRHLAHLHNAGYTHLYGVEINEEARTVMNRAYPELAADATIFERPFQTAVQSFDDDQFDVVYSVETLELIPPDDEWVFDHLRRICRQLLITVENEGDNTRAMTVIEDFPLFYRNWKDVLENEQWRLVETKEMAIDTLRVFVSDETVATID